VSVPSSDLAEAWALFFAQGRNQSVLSFFDDPSTLQRRTLKPSLLKCREAFYSTEFEPTQVLVNSQAGVDSQAHATNGREAFYSRV
jgi:hypothetical protein